MMLLVNIVKSPFLNAICALGSLLAVSIGLSHQVSAQEMPGEEEIIQALSPQIPVWWSVESVSIEASVNDGDEVEPRIRQRFIATVKPTEDLFESVDAVGPFKALIPVHEAGNLYKLYGISSSELRLGKWVTQVRLGNSVNQLGAPRSFHDGPTVLADSDEFGKTSETVRILANLKNRWKNSLSHLDSAIDTMRDDSQQLVSELSGQIRAKVATARETAVAIEQALAEADAQRQLTSALEEKTAESNRAIEARKSLYQSLRAKLASEDPDERLATFHAVFDVGQFQLTQQERQNLLETVLKSKDPGLQGAALFNIFARKPEFSLKQETRTHEVEDEIPLNDHVLSFEVSRLWENYQFEGYLTFNDQSTSMRSTGTIHGNQLIMSTNSTDRRSRGHCAWNAEIEDDGMLRGKLECAPPFDPSITNWRRSLDQSVTGIWEARFFF